MVIIVVGNPSRPQLTNDTFTPLTPVRFVSSSLSPLNYYYRFMYMNIYMYIIIIHAITRIYEYM